MKRKPGKTPIGLKVSGGLIGLVVLAVIALSVFARFGQNPSNIAEVRAILEEARLERVGRAVAFEKARKAVPSGAPVPSNWDFRALLDSCDSPPLTALAVLVSSYVDNPNDLPEDVIQRVRDVPGYRRHVSQDSPFYFPIDVDKQSKTELLEQLRRLLGSAKEFTQIEAALDLGLGGSVVDAFTSPRYSNLLGVSILFAGHAVCQLESGDSKQALDTCFAGYRLAGLLGQWPHSMGYSEQYGADRILDRALYRIVDATFPQPACQARILDAFDRRKPLDGMAKGFRFHAAHIEAGLEAESRGLPEVTSIGFAFTGRGTLDRAKQLIAILERPPHEVHDELTAIRKPTVAGYWTNKFVDFATRSYGLHAREALTGDVARLVFALKTYARDHGAYPASLDQVTPFPLAGVPTDPVSGQPLTYATDTHSFTISAPAVDDIWPEVFWIARK